MAPAMPGFAAEAAPTQKSPELVINLWELRLMINLWKLRLMINLWELRLVINLWELKLVINLWERLQPRKGRRGMFGTTRPLLRG